GCHHAKSFHRARRRRSRVCGGVLAGSRRLQERRPAGRWAGPGRAQVGAVGNPGGPPVLAAVAVRRALLPGWLTGAVGAIGSTVPRRTARRAYRPTAFPTVAVVPGGQCAELSAPVPPA